MESESVWMAVKSFNPILNLYGRDKKVFKSIEKKKKKIKNNFF